MERKLCIALCEPPIQNNRIKNVEMTWGDFVAELEKRHVTTPETYAEYIAMSSAEQTRIKDIGGFIGGKFSVNRRKNEALLHRDLLCLDIDNPAKDFMFLYRLLSDDWRAILHTTHKHSPEKPRYRIIMPFSENVSPQDYEKITRNIGELLTGCDEASYRPTQVMFWPSNSIDGKYIQEIRNGKYDLPLPPALFLPKEPQEETQPDGKRKKRTREEREEQLVLTQIQTEKKRFGDPRKRGGLVGQMTRLVTPEAAIDEMNRRGLLNYIPTGNGRWKNAGSKGVPGVVLLEDTHIYSHHGTDPLGGKARNVFDFFAAVLFPQLCTPENDAIEDPKQQPKYKAMLAWANKDTWYRELVAQDSERDFDAYKDTLPDPVTVKPDPTKGEPEQEPENDWVKGLPHKNGNGVVSRPLAQHVDYVFKNCPDLKGLFSKDYFLNQIKLTRSPFWPRESLVSSPTLTDEDEAFIRRLFATFGIQNKDLIHDGLIRAAAENATDCVKAYLERLTWDGTLRIDTALIDFFGCPESEYNRAVSRLLFLACVKRIYKPGCKFDSMLVLKGPQGCGKSTFFDRLGGEWFSDNIRDLSNKDATLGLFGVWIHEFSELTAFKKSDAELIKQFISRRTDRIRPPYGRNVEVLPRRCVLVGSTNEAGFLRDKTGNRRFIICEIPKQPRPRLSVWKDLTEEYRGQLFAEALDALKHDDYNTPLVLPPGMEAVAAQIQEGFMQEDPMRDDIINYLERPIPADWYSWSVAARIAWLADPANEGTEPRKFVCIKEIWIEALEHSDTKQLDQIRSRLIADIMNNLPDWEFAKNNIGTPKTKRIPGYATQRYYVRI